MAEVGIVKRSKLWNSIYDIVNQLYLETVAGQPDFPTLTKGDGVDVPSTTTALEKLFIDTEMANKIAKPDMEPFY